MIEGIIFDVDGTLWDSTDKVAESWNAIIEEYENMDKTLTGDILKKEFGKPMDQIMDSLFPGLSVEEKNEFAEKLYARENADLVNAECYLYDGLQETIKTLAKQYDLFIVSNCQAGYIEVFLENTGLGSYIKDFTCPGDTGVMKAENIRIIMERNHIKSAVYVGDTQGDADACKDADIPMIYAAYGFGEVEEDYKTIYSLKELEQVIEEL